MCVCSVAIASVSMSLSLFIYMYLPNHFAIPTCSEYNTLDLYEGKKGRRSFSHISSKQLKPLDDVNMAEIYILCVTEILCTYNIVIYINAIHQFHNKSRLRQKKKK